MENQDRFFQDELPQQAVFALDIGTRSIIGMVGILDEERIHIIAIEKAEHTQRAMIDGQIENIDQVARVAGIVKDKLEKRLGLRLTRVAVAAAGRALRTESVSYELELPNAQRIDAELVSRLEAGAISEAEKAFASELGEEKDRRFYLVGYSVCRYYLDNYMISSLIDHNGRVLKADIIATFLPSEVVESLYSTMHKIGLDVASLTLEPIAAMNAAIPPNIRLLNLAMVDIGAGTSDIAVCRDGAVTGYTMAIQAGDEITETIMKAYLVDFQTAERIKSEMGVSGEITFTDIMGFDQTVTGEQLFECIKDASASLCEEISAKIVEANGGVPSAVYLAGGGSQLLGLRDGIVDKLHIDPKRVAIAGRNFKVNAYSEEYDLDNPEYTTPLGIVISAGLNMINDSFRVILNGHPAKLFRSGVFTVMNILMMNGYNYQDMLGKSGQNLIVYLNGERKAFYGEKAEPCVLKLNGKETQLSEIVHAGDTITFIPAKHGKDASAMLSQLAIVGGDRTVTVNGIEAASDMELKSGDVVLVDGMYAPALDDRGQGLAQEAEAEEKNDPRQEMAPLSTEDQKPEEDLPGDEDLLSETEKKEELALTSDTDKKEDLAQTSDASRKEDMAPASDVDKKEDMAQTSDAGREKDMAQTSSAGDSHLTVSQTEGENRSMAKNPQKKSGHSDQSSFPAEKKKRLGSSSNKRKKSPSASSARVASPGKQDSESRERPRNRTMDKPPKEKKPEPRQKIVLYLNDRHLILPPKSDGTPYYLMDMLQYTGLDLKKLSSPVALKVNGTDGAFQQELKDGDKISIYEERL